VAEAIGRHDSKSLLRHPEAVSPLSPNARVHFQKLFLIERILREKASKESCFAPERFTTSFCQRAELKREDVVILRLNASIANRRFATSTATLASMSAPVVWVQGGAGENMGPWRYLRVQFRINF
jgi:2-oxoglutarate dehydrogenase complex dehydrogenase (E1) component-like enzyme